MSVISASGKLNLQIAASVPALCSSCVSNALASAAEVSELFTLKAMCLACNSQAGFLPTELGQSVLAGRKNGVMSQAEGTG